MEKILLRFMRWFYLVMVAMLTTLAVNTLVLGTCLILELIVGVLSAFNAVLFISCLQYNLRGKYVQGKWALVILSITMPILIGLFAVGQIETCDCGWFMTVQTMFDLILVESIIIYRIRNIKYLQHLSHILDNKDKEEKVWII